MSQKAVYALLKELGGRATSREISELARKRYPEATLYAYVTNRLRKLQNWGYVTRNADGSWEIVTDAGPPP